MGPLTVALPAMHRMKRFATNSMAYCPPFHKRKNRLDKQFVVIIVVIPECRSRESVFAVVVLFRNNNSPNASRRLTLGNDKRKRLLIKQAVILNLFQNLHFGPFVVTVLSRLF